MLLNVNNTRLCPSLSNCFENLGCQDSVDAVSLCSGYAGCTELIDPDGVIRMPVGLRNGILRENHDSLSSPVPLDLLQSANQGKEESRIRVV